MDEERKRDDGADQELPGSVSDQNREEAEPGHGGGAERRRPADATSPGGSDGGSGGEAGEGSQSTGNPDSAG